MMIMEDELLADPRLTIVGLFVEAAGGLLTRLGSVHAAHGFAGSDFDTLIRLARSPDRRLRMSDLAAQVSLSTSGITRIVDRLESQGLIRREMCVGDRRATWAVLTDEGDARLRAELPQLIDAIQECLVDPLTGPQLEGLVHGLCALRDALHPTAEASART
jgi:MarR family 2-MHQ and catechol resistance regulon transcriptional repressor